MAFESLKQNNSSGLSSPVESMLTRYEERAERGLIERKEMDRSFALVEKALKTVKDQLKDPVFVASLNEEDLAKLSNAWHAWGNEKFFPDAEDRRALATLLMDRVHDKKKDRAFVYARQIWRTEVTSMLTDLLSKNASKTEDEKSKVLEQIMASQKAKKWEDSPFEALSVSMYLDKAISDKSARQKLADEMRASAYTKEKPLLAGKMKEVLKGQNIADFRVTVGGGLLSIPENMRGQLKLKNVAFRWDEKRVYAQMANGSEGNLVIIDLQKASVGKPSGEPSSSQQGLASQEGAAVVGGAASDGEARPEEASQAAESSPDGYSEATASYGAAQKTESGFTMRSGSHAANLMPSAEQYGETVDLGLVSDELFHKYETLGIEPFFQALDKLETEQQKAVLSTILKTVGPQDPQKALKFLRDASTHAQDGAHDAVSERLDLLITASENNESTRSFWILQKGLFDGQYQSAEGSDLPALFEQLRAIKPEELPEELRPLYESNKRALEFFTKRSLSLDMVGTSFSVMNSTFDPSDLRELIESGITRDSWAKRLRDEFDLSAGLGALNVRETDEEVYVSSWQVLEALRMAITYQYPQDVLAGQDIPNPVKHYYELLKTGKLNQIMIPQDIEVNDVFTDPLGKDAVVQAGGKIDLSAYFIARDAEFELFEEYQHGDESLGSNNWLSLFEGDQGAFMGEGSWLSRGSGSGAGGLIDASDGILSGNPFGTEKELGGSEKLYLQKIIAAVNTKHYDEARELCLSILERNGKLPGAEPSDVQIEERTTELDKKYGPSTRASLSLALKAQGVTPAMLQRLQKPDGTGPYMKLSDYVKDKSLEGFKHRAFVELQGERADSLLDTYITSSLGADSVLFGSKNTLKPAVERMNEDGFSQMDINAVLALSKLNGQGALRLSAENEDVGQDVAKTVAEIAAIEIASGFLVNFAAVGVGGARVVGVGTRTSGLARYGADAGQVAGAAFNSRYGTRVAAGLAPRLAPGTLGGRAVGGLNRVGGAWGGRVGIAARNVGHAAFFVGAQNFLNTGNLLPEFSQQTLYDVGSMAITLYGLGKVQQFTRGETAGARALADANAPRTWTAALSSPLASSSRRLGEWNRLGRETGGLAYFFTLDREIAAEVAALHALGSVQLSLGEMTGLLSPEEAAAMKDPDHWSSLAHTLGVVIGLRAAAGAGTLVRPREATPVVVEPVVAHGVTEAARTVEVANRAGNEAFLRAEEAANTARTAAETASRNAAEAARTAAAAERAALEGRVSEAERLRTEAETARTNAEAAKTAAEAARTAAETVARDAETARAEAERLTQEANAARDAARQEAQEAQVRADAAKMNAEQARQEAETVRAESERLTQEANAARGLSETERNAAQQAAQEAQVRADAAETAAQEAGRRAETAAQEVDRFRVANTQIRNRANQLIAEAEAAMNMAAGEARNAELRATQAEQQAQAARVSAERMRAEAAQAELARLTENQNSHLNVGRLEKPAALESNPVASELAGSTPVLTPETSARRPLEVGQVVRVRSNLGTVAEAQVAEVYGSPLNSVRVLITDPTTRRVRDEVVRGDQIIP